ncbi:hypothetical protein HK097_008676 [Rhizophlyctis rosea]|uniref:CRAL-TRIO domain-containing protein n=1 Tax=Rhizophlyctis rosea TaxID=64517 RepID=A0AAD5SA28_9FUNG|nr:hypothetical protein HK097_008676 [Rhizophlyctis rosea]
MVEPGHIGNLTAAQEEALQKLRTVAAEEVAKLSMNTEEEWLNLWGVSMQNLATDTKNKAQTVLLLKFLRARDFDVQKATQMIIDTLKWRKEFNIVGLMNETFPKAYDELGVVYGQDRLGNPVTYNFYGTIGATEVVSNPDRFVRWRVQLMEKAVAQLDFANGKETVTQIHDYAGAGLSMPKELKGTTKEIISLFQDHYPEFLEKKLFLNIPAVMELFFNFFSSFSSRRTQQKFQMVSRTKGRATLLQFIAPTELPPQLGGFANGDSGTLSRSAGSMISDEKGDKGEVVSVDIAARTDKEVKLAVQSGDEVEWEVMATTHDIGVGIKILNGDVETEEKKVELVEFGRGSFVAKEGGEAVLVLSNTHSYLTGKTVLYRFRVKK